jgi:hypothetical protein
MVLLCLQILDVSGYLKNEKVVLTRIFIPAPITPTTTEIEALVQKSAIVIFYPQIACPNDDSPLLVDVQMRVAKEGKLLNTAYFAHFKSPICSDQAGDFPGLNPKLLVSNLATPSTTIQMLLKSHPKACHTIGQTYYCEYSS